MKLFRCLIILLSIFAFVRCTPETPEPTKPNQEQNDPDNPGDNPGTDNPGGDTPGGDTPGGDTPGGDTPGGDTPGPVVTNVLATVYTQSFDGDSSYYGYMSDGNWNNATGTGAASASYDSWNANISNNSYGSANAYTGASGVCYANIFQSNSGVFGHWTISGISTGSYRNFRFSFGTIQTSDVLTLEVSHDGSDWTSLAYSHGKSYNSWGRAEVCFSTGSGVSSLSIRFTLTGAKSSYTYGAKLDDLLLEAVDTEYETVIGGNSGGGGGGGQQIVSKYAELPVIDNSHSDYYYNTLYTTTVSSKKHVRNFSFCYDTRRHNPIWVAFPMHSIYAEGYGRSIVLDDQGNPVTDDEGKTFDPWMQYPDLPVGKQSIIWDIEGNGYQYWSAQSAILGGRGSWTKGHLCMSSSRTGANQEINLQTFYPVNIAPQSNKYAGAGIFGDLWGKTEDFHWQRGSQICSDTLYVVAGCHYANDNNIEYDACNSNTRSSYSKPCVIPTHQYKIFLRTRSGNTGKPVNKCSENELKTIGFWFDSVLATGSSTEVSDYAVSVAEIERRTGLTFFPDIPAAVKNQCTPGDWGL